MDDRILQTESAFHAHCVTGHKSASLPVSNLRRTSDIFGRVCTSYSEHLRTSDYITASAHHIPNIFEHPIISEKNVRNSSEFWVSKNLTHWARPHSGTLFRQLLVHKSSWHIRTFSIIVTSQNRRLAHTCVLCALRTYFDLKGRPTVCFKMINCRFEYFVRYADFFREWTTQFIPEEVTARPDMAWHGLTSSGNEVCSSFPEEFRSCQAVLRLLQGMNELHSSGPEEVTARSGLTRPDFFGERT